MKGLRTFSKQAVVICAGVCAAAAFFPAEIHAQGQGGQAVERAQLLRTQAALRDEPPGTTEGGDSAAPASPNDPDLGDQAILKRAEHYRAFTVYASAPVSYTSNVALSRSNEQGDVLFTPGIGISYAPRFSPTFFGNFSVGQQFFLYDRFDGLDFGSFDLRAGLSYVLPNVHNLLLRADYDYNRLTGSQSFDAFFTSHSIVLGAEVPFRIGRAQQVSVGTDLSFVLAADPDQPARHDFSVFAAYQVNLTRALTASVVGRLAVREYVEGSRRDVSGTLALGLNYRFTEWLSANAVSTLATSDSNQDVFDYEVANIGAALSLAFRF
ncbi:MAG: outer membrane beta-barrel protein [Verrucomicrobiota bacterium]|nr:outer membrane beta-barrel protein [Verrucomicrobiota bacterium]